MVKIEPTKDPKIITSLCREVQEWHEKNYPSVFRPFDETAIRSFFSEMLHKENIVAYVAIEDKVAIGYIILETRDYLGTAFKNPYKVVYIDQICVKSKYRKKGAGKLLMNKATDVAKENNILRIELDHWSANTNAKKFFLNAGFRNYNERMIKEPS